MAALEQKNNVRNAVSMYALFQESITCNDKFQGMKARDMRLGVAWKSSS
jgi:hypothetical protein